MLTAANDIGIDVDPQQERILLNLLDRLWLMPIAGGQATPLTPWGLRLTHAKISPDGKTAIAEGGWQVGAAHLWSVDLATGEPRQLTSGDWNDTRPSWHPGGKRVLFASDRLGTKDIWEYQIDSGETIRLTTQAGDEYDPVFDNAGEQIIYAAQSDGVYQLMRQYYKGRPRVLYTSEQPIGALSVRRDGMLITFSSTGADGEHTLNMLLPVQEMLVKPLVADRGLSQRPISWINRNTYLTAINGRLQARRLAARGYRRVPFTAWASVPKQPARQTPVQREVANTGQLPFVLRTARMVDVKNKSYLMDRDVLIEAGKIAAVVPRQEWPQTLIIDLGDSTLVPGLIDIDARLPAKLPATIGARLLAAGVTTVATIGQQPVATSTAASQPAAMPWRASHSNIVDLRQITDNRQRIEALKKARQQTQIAVSHQLMPDLLYGVGLLSIDSVQQQTSATDDTLRILFQSGTGMISAMGSHNGWAAQDWQRLTTSRLLPDNDRPTAAPAFNTVNRASFATLLVAGSGDSPLPAPVALQGEMLAMSASGVPAGDVLGSATWRAADALGLSNVGQISPDFIADLLIVDGDPLTDVSALLNTVAVVHEGQFSSVASLLELAQQAR